MAHNALLAGGLLFLIILLLARLRPTELLHPSRRTQILTGLAVGAVAALVLVVLRLNAPELGVTAYPTATAFMALYFGALSMLVTGAMALLAALWGDSAAWWPACLVLAGAGALGLVWRRVDQRLGANPWVSIVGMALVLPPVVALCLVVSGQVAAPDSAAGWLQLLPWYHGAGMLILGTGRQLLVGRAIARQALEASHHTLQEREQQLHLALGALGGGRWQWNVLLRQVRLDGRFYEAFGVTAADADAPDLWQRWYALRHPDDVARNAAMLARAMDGLEENYEAEFRVRDTSGRWRWLMSRGTVSQRDAAGRPIAMIGMDVDITAHREVEDALRSSEAKYTTFYQTLPDPAGITRISDGLYIDVNPAFCEALGLAREAVIGRTSSELSIWADEHERERLVSTFALDGQVDRLPMVAQRGGVRIPGLMSARSVVINGEDCFVFIFHDITEAQRTSDELLTVNSLLQQASRLARLGAWENRPDGKFNYWTDMCFVIHGLSPDTPPPENYVDRYVAPAYRDALRAKMRECIRTRADWDIEMQVLHEDGHPLWARARGAAVVVNDRVVSVRGVLQDIDDAKRAEQRLRQSEERFSRFFYLMPYPMGMSRYSDGTYLDINPAFEALIGLTREHAVGRTPMELGILSASQRDQLQAETLNTGELSARELEIRTAHGEKLTVLQSMRKTEFEGEQRWMFAVHDISDRKQAELRLREREELLSLTISAASLGLWDWNIRTGVVNGDSRWHALRGLPERDAETQGAQWTHTMAPDDLERITAELARHTAHPDTPFDATWRVTQPGGGNEGVRWVRSLGKIVGFDASGRPERMLGVAIDVTPQREQEVMLQRMALYDALTGLPNRVLLARRLQDGMAQARQRGTLLGVAYLDLDGFKPVNDRLGHGAGDRLLVVVAGRLTRALRPADSVARLGGDEFVILMPDLASHDECQGLLQKVMESISAPYMLDTERVMVTASIGYTLFPQDAADADALLRHADQAMYAAKQAGRNRFHQFDAAQERALQQLREQGRHLRDALANAQFMLYVQPKVDMRSGTVVGAEALARWQHPQRGVVAPGEFLHLLEGTELEISFGEWVAEAALSVLEQLQAQGLPLPLSINIAAQHLQQPGFAGWMAQCLARHPEVPAHLLEIEITESAALYDLTAVAAALTDLRALGVTVSLDDFGTGYSSLTYLRRLPMDTLKIDQSFVHGMMGDPGDLAIVQGVIGLARSFGYRVIAEGVETVEQGQMLLQLGCLQAQGYCIARPMPLEDFIGWTPHWQPPTGWQRNRPI